MTDSTGRSVSYGYTGADLTSFTDAEQKTIGYAYDTNHDVIATYDALGRLVVTNLYDGFGHVNTQFTQGLTNKTWQIFPSGCFTVEIDPAGGQKVMTYDRQYRLIAQQDALGNVTQMAYDGQDHVIQTISPLGETNQFIYDGNNNLIETIDPLGFASQFIYDANNNLVETVDPRGNPTTFGYNAQFSLTGQTNGAGDWVNYAFNSDGTLHTRIDSGSTNTYGYDAYGQLNNITYPGGIGGESFVNSPLGDATSHTDANHNATAFAYNNRRQLTNSVAPANLVTTIAYDAVGNVSGTTDARNNTVSNTWSATRHLLTTTLPPMPAGVPVITNSYDGRDWLTRTADPLHNPTLITDDLAGRMIAATDPLLRTNTFSYDPDGHRLASVNAANETNRQTWDARGSLIQAIDGAGHTSARAYDAAGNQIILTNRNGNKWQFQFDAANRLISTITPMGRSNLVVFNHQGLPTLLIDKANQTTTNTFDGLGRLITRGDKVATTTNFYDGNNNLTNVFENGKTNVWTYDAYNRVSTYRDTVRQPDPIPLRCQRQRDEPDLSR